MNRVLAILRNKYLDSKRVFDDNRKIIVIESDDWGSIRTSNRSAYLKIRNLRYPVSNSPYMLDCLETDEDLSALFNVLKQNSTLKGDKPKFTANIITANPDFNKIHDSGYENYFYETVQDRSSRLGLNLVNKWNQGREEGIFIPEFHGREHVNWPLWLNDLKIGHVEAKLTFDLEMCGLPQKVSALGQSYYTHVYDDSIHVENLILDGIKHYHGLFGVYPRSSIAPNVTWDHRVEEELSRHGITSIQSGKVQREIRGMKSIYKSHYTGEMNRLGQIYSVRNVTFEPSRSQDMNYWKKSFSQIQSLFEKGRPAIVSTHRVNYVGSISESNSKKSLIQLDKLLRAINKAYPNVVYMSTAQLEETLRNL